MRRDEGSRRFVLQGEKMKRAALALCLVLCACGTTEVVYKPVPVNVTVPVPCHAPAVTAPAWPTASVAPTASMFDKVKAALAELNLRRGYEARLEAANKSCQ